MPNPSEDIEIRRELRPGDLGTIVREHGRIYAREHGVDRRFEAMVATAVADAAARGWPGAREGVWIVERDGEFAGCLALTDEGNGLAAIRWVFLHPSVRGRGIGRRLIAEAVATAEKHGYETLGLETFSELTTAAQLYREQGFELIWEDPAPRWGREEITYQRYELSLRRAEPRRSDRDALAGSA
jgi:N-acetylglutamate synthase-like GNAT family acetyltransferase